MSTLRFGLVLLSVVLISSQVSALICWRCSSDSSSSDFCQEKLDFTKLRTDQRHFYYTECTAPTQPMNIYGRKMVSKCRMEVQIQGIPGKKVYTRQCVVEAENDEPNACLVRSVLPNVQILACETCRENGCNEVLSEKLSELKIEGDNSAGMKTMFSMQLLSIVFGVMWFLL